MIQHRDAPDEQGLERRFFELRYDGERRITGTAIRYGDEAELPWGDRERFEPGAFGNVGGADVTLNVQHDRGRLIARTGGGGLTLSDDSNELRMEAVLPDTREANDVLTLVRGKVLRGLSIEFRPKNVRRELQDGVHIAIISKAELRGIAVVDRPAYPKSKVQPRSESEMDEARIQEIIDRAVEAALNDASDNGIDQEALTRAVSTAVTSAVEGMQTGVREQIDAALEERDEAREQAETAANQAREDAEAAEDAVEARADLLVLVDGLLPDDTVTRGKSNKELLVLAVGNEVQNAEDRSEDYLLAKVEEIAERRDAAATGGPLPPGNLGLAVQASAGAGSSDPIDMHRMIERRRQRAASA